MLLSQHFCCSLTSHLCAEKENTVLIRLEYCNALQSSKQMSGGILNVVILMFKSNIHLKDNGNCQINLGKKRFTVSLRHVPQQEGPDSWRSPLCLHQLFMFCTVSVLANIIFTSMFQAEISPTDFTENVVMTNMARSDRCESVTPRRLEFLNPFLFVYCVALCCAAWGLMLAWTWVVT